VASIGIVVIEDGGEGFRLVGEDRFVADVDAAVCVGGDELLALATKGPITAAE